MVCRPAIFWLTSSQQIVLRGLCKEETGKATIGNIVSSYNLALTKLGHEFRHRQRRTPMYSSFVSTRIPYLHKLI